MQCPRARVWDKGADSASHHTPSPQHDAHPLSHILSQVQTRGQRAAPRQAIHHGGAGACCLSPCLCTSTNKYYILIVSEGLNMEYMQTEGHQVGDGSQQVAHSSVLGTDTHLHLYFPPDANVFSLMVPRRQLRLRGVKELAQGHTAIHEP